MKRICDLQIGEKIMYRWVWYQVIKKTDKYVHLFKAYESGSTNTKKLPVESKEYVQYETGS